MAERNSAESYSMHNILVGIEDPALRDQVRTALKVFPSIRGAPIQRGLLLDLLSGGGVPAAVIVDYQRGRSGADPFIEAIRAANRDVHVLACAERPERPERPERNHFNKAKVDLDIFSFIPLPLDPFDLLRRLHRLVEALPAA